MKRSIPNYDLYGDQSQDGWVNAFQFERIHVRSSSYNYDIRPHTHDSFIQVLYLRSGGGRSSSTTRATTPANPHCC